MLVFPRKPVWNNFICPEQGFLVTEGNVKIKYEKKIWKFLNMKILWHFPKLNKLTRFLDEITMFDKTMKIVSFRDGIVLIT